MYQCLVAHRAGQHNSVRAIISSRSKWSSNIEHKGRRRADRSQHWYRWVPEAGLERELGAWRKLARGQLLQLEPVVTRDIDSFTSGSP
jgi:hypothetical protein